LIVNTGIENIGGTATLHTVYNIKRCLSTSLRSRLAQNLLPGQP
jgi:hypothetical protein